MVVVVGLVVIVMVMVLVAKPFLLPRLQSKSPLKSFSVSCWRQITAGAAAIMTLINEWGGNFAASHIKQLSAVQCSAVQCSAVQCSAVQCSAMHCSAV